MCDCGCNTCETKKAVMLNESIAPKEILSEGLKYHMNNNIPLTEHVYRAGSQNYFNLWAEARALYSRGILEVQGDDLEVLTETDLSHYGIFEGKKVPLDFPMLDEDLDEQKEYTKGNFEQMASREFKPGTATNSEIVALARKAFLDYKFGKGFKHHFPKTFNIFEAELNDFPFEYKGFKYNVESTEGMVNDRGQKVWQVSIQDREGDIETTTVRGSSDREGHQEAKDFIDDELLPYYGLDEAKKKKKKDPPIGKPMRSSSGGKAYKVYVRDPKTKKVKTVRFGSGGLRAKINDPKARQAFAKRHKCSTKKDKTKASYWSCRLPRYAKLLGLKSSFSGFW